jgi:hypothetical protein
VEESEESGSGPKRQKLDDQQQVSGFKKNLDENLGFFFFIMALCRIYTCILGCIVHVIEA